MEINKSPLPLQTPVTNTRMAADPKAMEQYRGDSNSREALQAAATQFEAMMVEEMLKSMRQATETLSEDNPFSSRQEQFYQSFYDSQLAFEMASQGNLGVADQLVEQVNRIQAAAETKRAETERAETDSSENSNRP